MTLEAGEAAQPQAYPPPAYLEVDQGIATLVLNRPKKLNAANLAMLEAVHESIDQAERDRSVRALVIRGAGRAFCSGGDLTVVGGLAGDTAQLEAFTDHWHRVVTRLMESPLPVIAAVHGLALAGGFELMLACDLVVAADDAKLGDQHARYGLFPGGGGSQLLPRLIGQRRAKWLMFSGETIGVQEALWAGLVNSVVPPAEVLPQARRMADILVRRSPVATAAMKSAIRLGMAEPDLARAFEIERAALIAQMQSADARIGLQAFRDRSEPRFIGE